MLLLILPPVSLVPCRPLQSPQWPGQEQLVSCAAADHHTWLLGSMWGQWHTAQACPHGWAEG